MSLSSAPWPLSPPLGVVSATLRHPPGSLWTPVDPRSPARQPWISWRLRCAGTAALYSTTTCYMPSTWAVTALPTGSSVTSAVWPAATATDSTVTWSAATSKLLQTSLGLSCPAQGHRSLGPRFFDPRSFRCSCPVQRDWCLRPRTIGTVCSLPWTTLNDGKFTLGWWPLMTLSSHFTRGYSPQLTLFSRSLGHGPRSFDPKSLALGPKSLGSRFLGPRLFQCSCPVLYGETWAYASDNIPGCLVNASICWHFVFCADLPLRNYSLTHSLTVIIAGLLDL